MWQTLYCALEKGWRSMFVWDKALLNKANKMLRHNFGHKQSSIYLSIILVQKEASYKYQFGIVLLLGPGMVA
jgi:hypothetical protein